MTLSAVVPAVLLVPALGVSIALAVIDLRSHRLPNRLVFALYPFALAYAVWRGFHESSALPVVGAAISASVLFAASYLLYRGGGLGGGDVKLAGALGLATGAHGWEILVLATAAAFLSGGLVALVLIALRRADRRTRIPFGPFMLAGAWTMLAIALF
ncbi:prepilin peptidase [Microbacterium oleivorans]|uniref:Prepilin peptidase n=1 Tax=Microbacterium oleivorans TaxID=273677 RepID=A0A7D5F8F8_9MICO|nr:A24 family peptidase [Microbacterium oleivorans]QLD12833.1 prepilin peptidase [Microbacterium oleivorans]